MGCTALLGDFEVSATNGTGTGDGSPSDDGSTTTDGPTDGGDPDAFDAQSTVFTQCAIGTPQPIETLTDPTQEFEGDLQIFRSGDNVRVIARRSMSEGVTVYTFNPDQNGSNGMIPTPTKLDLGAAGRYLDARRLANQGILALMFLERDAINNTAHVKVLELPDNNPSVASSPPIRLSQNFASPNSGNISGSLGGYTNNNEYFWALGEVQDFTTPGNYDLLVGHRISGSAIPAPFVLHSGPEERVTGIRFMARSQATYFLANDKGPENASDKGTAFFVTPENPTTIVPPVSLSPANGKPFVMFGLSGNTTGDGMRMAAAEVDFNSATSFGTVRAGLIKQADVNASFDGTKIPTAFTINSLIEVPAEGEARFFGDDMLWLGSPPGVLKGQGLNFIWFNTQTRVVRVKQVGASKLLATRTTLKGSALVLKAQNAVSADIDLVFTEKLGTGSVLQYARMSCLR